MQRSKWNVFESPNGPPNSLLFSWLSNQFHQIFWRITPTKVLRNWWNDGFDSNPQHGFKNKQCTAFQLNWRGCQTCCKNLVCHNSGVGYRLLTRSTTLCSGLSQERSVFFKLTSQSTGYFSGLFLRSLPNASQRCCSRGSLFSNVLVVSGKSMNPSSLSVSKLPYFCSNCVYSLTVCVTNSDTFQIRRVVQDYKLILLTPPPILQRVF